MTYLLPEYFLSKNSQQNYW